MKDDESLLRLLQIIRVNGNTMYLLKQGVSLFTLSKNIAYLKKEGYIVNDQQKLMLSSKGKTLFNELSKKLGRRGLYKYLSNDISLRFEPDSFDEVFIPYRRGNS